MERKISKERLTYIKRCFARYRKNKAMLKQIAVPGTSGIAYDKPSVTTDKSQNSAEQMIMTFLIKREPLETEIAFVDAVYNWYADERNAEIAALIDHRFRKGESHRQASDSVYICERQGFRWLDEVYSRAEIIGEKMHVFDSRAG